MLAALVPPSVVTWTSTGSAVWAGAVTVHVVAVQENSVAGLPGPKVSAVAPIRPVPFTVTIVPPFVVPAAGLSDVTTGTGA
ncbi:hypothetical protein ADK75_37895 [Streptomyces virginiae]|uniref:Uncharacterized protein n=1 Tax=Streptomyces virginiae TaxID=1961 RepID=A0A0L8M0T9_STRVG|nr:hypothetical protein ADK75_37895 [Streptomyces virginiae]